jgi:threonine dehydrogenase-like Zn-dependent dehydrogenase
MNTTPYPLTMRAVLLTDDGPCFVPEYPTPRPGPGEALVRVRLAGICSTDLELTRGYKGGFRGILGHEFVGEIVEAQDDPARVGERVVGEINIGCGACDLCARGLHKHCRARRVLGIHARDGCFADYLTLPLANLHPVGRLLTDESAVFTEPLAAALQVLEQAHIRPSMRVYVLGPGRLGQLIAQVIQETGCDLTLIGRRADALALAALRGIATAQINSGQIDSADALARTPADVVVEATGSPDGFALARRFVRPGGAIVLKSTFAGTLPEFDASALVVDEVTLIGSRCGPFAPALALLRRKGVDVRPLITARSPIEQAIAALDHARRPGALKVLLTFG